MTPQEIAAQLLAKSKQGASDSTDSKTDYYRKRKAQEFVQGYIAVLKLKNELIEAGLAPDEFTEALAISSLVDMWEEKAEAKSSIAI
jgi:hypothetical protein